MCVCSTSGGEGSEHDGQRCPVCTCLALVLLPGCSEAGAVDGRIARVPGSGVQKVKKKPGRSATGIKAEREKERALKQAGSTAWPIMSAAGQLRYTAGAALGSSWPMAFCVWGISCGTEQTEA